MPPIVEVHGATKRFSMSRLWALNGLDLILEPGQILGLLGPNGSGKSTLLKILAGVQRPTSGVVRVLGKPPGLETKRTVAYLPDVDHLFPFMTSRQAARFAASFYEDFDPERAAALFEILAVPPEQRYGELSRGHRGRFKLALTLARNAALLLLDEPLSGIDLVSRDRILVTLLAEYRLGEQAIILATHQIAEAEMLFDRIVFVREGRSILTGDAEELRAQRGRSIEDIYREEFDERPREPARTAFLS